MRVRTGILLAAPLLFGASLSFAIPNDSIQDAAQVAAHDPAAVAAFNAGVKIMKEADAFDDAAATDTNGPRRAEAQKKARDAYTRAGAKFQDATQRDRQIPEAWNNLGYTQRKLGAYDAALLDYSQALQLQPGFPQAIEYRAVAYLALNRVADAKKAYLDLFARDRAASDQLLTEMKHWVATHQKKRGDVDTATVADFAKWVQERSQIAAQTASLTRAGTALSWR